jgi:hypothetical protein
MEQVHITTHRRVTRLTHHIKSSPTTAEAASYPSGALNRVSGMAPNLTVPMNFFDYNGWDKVTKPANFNMRIPPELKAEAKKRMDAAAKRININVPIYDGRPVQEHITLDTAGFCVQTSPTVMEGQDFYDIQTLHKKYFPECIDYVKRMTGATKVLPFDHSIRNKLLLGQDGISGCE